MTPHPPPKVTEAPKLKWTEWSRPLSGKETIRSRSSDDRRFIIYGFIKRSGDRYKLFDGGRFVCRGSLQDCVNRAEEMS